MEKVADKNELIEVLDEQGNSLNRLEQRRIIHEEGIWHNEVACVVLNNKRQILLQKRSENKKSYPGCWGLFAGHVVGYETIIEAIIKEMREELVSEIKEENIFLLVSKMKNEREDNKCFVTCFCTFINKSEEDILYQKEEIDAVKWFDFSEFKNMIINEEGTIFKNNNYYNTLVNEIEKLFASKNLHKKIDDITEKIEELDKYGNETGKIVTREYAHNFGIYHKSVSLFILNDKNEILLQKRALTKIRNAGLWDVSVSGHVRFGENDISAIIRECEEETKYKIKEKDIEFLLKYKENRKFNEKFIDNSWFNVYVTRVNTLNEEVHDMEVEENKFFTINELKEKMKTYKDLAYKPEAFNAIIEYIESNK